MTNYQFNVGHSNPQDPKIIYEFAEEMKFDINNIGRKSPRDRSLVELLNSPAIMASGISTTFLPENPNELCDRLKLLLLEKQAGNNSDLINEETVAIFDELLDYKCISKKQPKTLLRKCLN